MSNLSQLRLEVRRRSDMEQSQFIKDPELTTYINQSYFELYDVLVGRFEDYYVTDFTDKDFIISSMTGDGTTTTVVTSSKHNLVTGLSITITDAVNTDFNTQAFITKVNSYTFTYPSLGNGTTTGATIKANAVIQVLSSVHQIGLPDDFYKLRGFDRSIGATPSSTDGWINVRSFNFAERNKRDRRIIRNLYGQFTITYRLFGNVIELRPSDASDGIYRYWYIPRVVPLLNDSDEAQNIMDFEEYIIVDSAIKCLVKEESDVSALMAQKAGILNRINTMASNRDVGEIERVGDVRSSYFDWDSYYINR